MELKVYKKEYEYSYSLGAFPTIELLKNRIDDVIEVIIHSSFDNKEVLNTIKSLLPKDKIRYNDKLVSKLSDKGNCFIIGVFKKYKSNLSDSDHILFDNPSNMGNLGTMIRSALGFNIINIAIIKPGLDYFDPKVIRASMGSIFSVNIEFFDTLADYKKKYNNHTIYSFMLDGKCDLRDVEFKANPLTLAFGNEATGLSSEYLDDNSIYIKHSKNIDSLNITNALSIALYEYSKNNF